MNPNDTSFFFSKVKVIFLGDPTVGKTSIISAIRLNEFNQRQESTVGIDFFAQIITKNNKSYKLQFWDTAGQQRFKSIIPSYVRNANVGIIVFDVKSKDFSNKDRTSYNNVKGWLESFRQNSAEGSRVLVVGNKIDLESRLVSQQQAKQRFHKENIPYLEVSAKTQFQITSMTEFLVECISCGDSEILDKQKAKSYTKLQQLVDQLPNQISQKRKCCLI